MLPTTLAPADVVFRTGEQREAVRCGGELLASLAPGGVPFYDVWRCDPGYLLRFHGYADFVLDEQLSEVRGHAHPGADPGMVAVFLEGSVLAVLLVLRGEPVLHASAVAEPRGVLALTGGSTAGKTSLAAALCGQGATLVTDDVLRLDVSGTPVLAYGGSSELRLRAEASADLLRDRPRRLTADGRSAVHLRAEVLAPSPLRAVVLPVLCRGLQAAQVEVLTGADAVLALVSAPRTAWTSAGPQRRLLGQLATLARSTPVVKVQLPWDAAGAYRAAGELSRLVEQALSRSS